MRWAAQIAAVLAVATIAIVAFLVLRRRETPVAKDVPPVPSSGEPIRPDPIAEGKTLRRAALDRCEKLEWDPCLRGLDDAAKLDPAGDADEAVKKARAAAAAAKNPPPAPSPSPSAAPTPTPAPTAAPTAAPTVKPMVPKKYDGKAKPSKAAVPYESKELKNDMK